MRSRALQPESSSAPLSQASVLAGFVACILTGLALSVLSIKLYSPLPVLETMFGDALRLTNEDSWFPMQAALTHIRSGAATGVYEQVFFTDKVKFQYPPTSLLFFDAFALFLTPTYRNLNLFNAALMPLLALILLLVARALALWHGTRQGLLWFTTCLAVALTLLPVNAALNLGQIQLWIDVLFAAACLLWLHDRRAAAGVLVGLCALIKPQFALFLLWGTVRRDWRFLRGLLGAALPLGVISLVLYGFWNHLEYLKVTSFIASHGENYVSNQSMNGWMHRLLGHGTAKFSDEQFAPYDLRVYLATLAVSVALIALACWARPLRERPGTPLDFAAAGLAFTLASPVVWVHHYGITAPIFLFALAAIREARDTPLGRALQMALFAGAYIAISAFLFAYIRPWTYRIEGILLQSYMYYGGLMLLALLLLLQWRGARPARR